MAGINTAGLSAMADGIGQLASLELVAVTGDTFETATIVSGSETAATFGAATAGVIDITTAAGGGGDVTLTISAGTITWVILRETDATLPTNALAAQSLSTDNVFTNGGDLIVTSFEITVT